MKKPLTYRATMTACYMASANQAIVCNYVPMLFLTFQRSFGLPLEQLTLLVTLNFLTQLVVDAICARVVDRIGYRRCIVTAHVLCAAGLISLAVLPFAFPTAFGGLLTAVIIYAVGGGIIEVLGSPIAEACPTENKAASMSLMHSFYCWGSLGVVLITTVLFHLMGIGNWRMISCLWALVPLANGILFLFVPIGKIVEEGRSMTLKELLGQKLFWIFLLLMLCSGAAENSVSQWASAFAESALGVDKTIGDLAGPCFFAILMGIGRVMYAKLADRISLERYITASTLLCIISYGLLVLPKNPVINLLGCGICGLSVAVMWPGSLSMAAKRCPRGGTALFALLALGGDIGCSAGPSVVGFVSGVFADHLKYGIAAAAAFPVLILVGVALLKTVRST